MLTPATIIEVLLHERQEAWAGRGRNIIKVVPFLATY
jgi:hypothetical protein